VIGNGEIYNYVELARDFDLEGVLATGSDFEPLLHIYARERPDGVRAAARHVRLCLHRRRRPRLAGPRPFGIKPLYCS
jgi:asparagine synthase (glutamine-hydrolysing)